jgi:hypothetical protein
LRRSFPIVFSLLFLAAGALAATPDEDAAGDGDPAGEEEGEEQGDEHGEHGSRFPDEPIPLDLEGFPERPKPVVELGEPFLGTGTLDPGVKLPTGAVWQPSLLAFGTFRTALQSSDRGVGGDDRITEWASRLDLFFNLALSGTERLVVGFRALDEGGRFTSYFFEHPDPALDGEFRDEIDADIETLFFEGDFGEIFPKLDWHDFAKNDIGFSIGRQPMFFQEGMLLSDTVDGVGFTRNTLLPRGTSNFRMTLFYGWDGVGAGGFERAANLWAFLTSTDLRATTMDVDVAYVQNHRGDGDLVAAGVSGVQRFGKLNSSLRLLGSFALDEEVFALDGTPFATDGLLFFSELSWTPPYGHDLVYVTTFWALGEYTAPARGPAVGGPLGRAGVNFASAGLGTFVSAPLSSRARDVAGGAVGYQKFFAHTRKQLLFELGARFGTEDDVEDQVAATVRYQTALGRRFVVVADAFVAHRRDVDVTPFGGRLELVVKF